VFEKYTEKARRVIFFARYEVSEWGSKSIETEHLLLGLLREDKALISSFLPEGVSADLLRSQIEAEIIRGEKISTAVEVPLSAQSKEVLKYAAEESENLGHRHIGTEHILLGLSRQKDSLAERVLRGNGLDLVAIRRQIRSDAGE
jgi:ATP-dependent Clp protease ATP-binding subunit ClpC